MTTVRPRCWFSSLTSSSTSRRWRPIVITGVKELRALGIQPDVLVCRADQEIPKALKDKIALFCSVTPDAVFSCKDASTIYEVPLNLHAEGLDAKVATLLQLPDQQPDLTPWTDLMQRIRNPKGSVRIAVVGKYVEFKESYKSLIEALHHAGYGLEMKVDLKWVEGESIEESTAEAHLGDCQGVLVPGGFGVRGTRGMIEAIRYAREKKVPFFGICLGMQMASVEFARRRGIPVLAFTDRIRSPLARLAENVLPVPGENLLYSHSLAAFAVLAHAIATSVATRDREGILLKLREAERVARPKFAVE